MDPESRQGAVPGIEVHPSGGMTVSGEEAIDYFRLCTIISALKLEIACPGLRASRFSALKAAKSTYKLKGNTKAAILAQLEKIRDAVQKEANSPSRQIS